MPPIPHNHPHRRRIARVYLAVIFLLLTGANLLLFRFAIRSLDSWRNLIGPLFGYGLASTLLLAGVWRRIAWSRIVLIGLNWLMITFFSLAAAYLGSDTMFGSHHSLVMFGPPIALFVLSNVWLIKSRRIRHLVAPPSSGG
jgi:hypothetical protein